MANLLSFKAGKQSRSAFRFAVPFIPGQTVLRGSFKATAPAVQLSTTPSAPPVLPPFQLFSSATAQAAAAQSAILGVDIRCITGLDPYFSLVMGPYCLAQDLVHRFATLRGQLFYDPDYGRSILQLLNEGITLSQSQISLIAKNLEAEALKDDRVATCLVNLSFNEATSTLTANIAIGTASGDFQFIVGITSLTVSLIEVVT